MSRQHTAQRFPIQRKCVVFSYKFDEFYDLLCDGIKLKYILKKSQVIIHFINFINFPYKMAFQSDSPSGSDSETQDLDAWNSGAESLELSSLVEFLSGNI